MSEPAGACAPKLPTPDEWTLDERIVADYVERCKPRLDKLLRFYAIQRSLPDAIEKAAFAKTPDGKRHAHQRRLSRVALEAVHKALRKANLEHVHNFAELLDEVHRAIGNIVGIGPLMAYDTALRIGAFLKREPDLVYIHAGVRQGAAALGVDASRESVEPGELPAPLRDLPPRDIENCLCIYKSALRALRKY